MIDYNKPFKCNDGLKARLAATNGTGRFSVAAWVFNPITNKEEIERYDREGNHISGLVGMKLVNISDTIWIRVSVSPFAEAELNKNGLVLKGPEMIPIHINKGLLEKLLDEMDELEAPLF